MKQSIPKKLQQVSIWAYFDTGSKAVIKSPHKEVKIGFRTQFGWRFLLIGAWIIFGKPKEFQTIINPLNDEPPEEVT